jgi:hypothetical protein
MIGCTTNAPEAYRRVFLADYRLQSLRLPFVDFLLSGARPALPMVVGPEAIAEFFWVEAQNIIL